MHVVHSVGFRSVLVLGGSTLGVVFLLVTSMTSLEISWKEMNDLTTKGHFTHEPRAVTMKLWEPKRKCSKAVPRSCSVVIVPQV